MPNDPISHEARKRPLFVTNDSEDAPHVAMGGLTPDDIEQLLKADEKAKVSMLRREAYYDGKQPVAGADKTNADNSPRVNVIHNVIQEVVDRHVGFALNDAVVFQPRGKVETKPPREQGDEPRDGFEQYDDTRHELRLDTMDIELYKECLVSGYGCEIHSFDPGAKDGKESRITQIPAHEMILVTDADDKMMVAIRRLIIKEMTFWRGKITRTQIDLITVYDDLAITQFIVETAAAQQGTEKKNQVYQLSLLRPPTPHGFAQMPVVIHSISKRRIALVDEPMLGLQDHLNDLASSNGNDVIENTKMKYVIEGYDTQDEKSRETFKKWLEEGIIFVDKDGGVTSMKGGNEVAEVQYQYEQTRKALFESGEAVDVRHIVGTTGSTSGIALRLISLPMEDRAATMTKYFKDGLRSRIDLLNVTLEGLKKTDLVLEDYEIIIETRQIVNEAEIWKSLRSLVDILPDQDIIAKIPGEESPKDTYQRLQEQRKESLQSRIEGVEAGVRTGPVRGQAANTTARKEEIAASSEIDVVDALEKTQNNIPQAELDRLLALAPA